MAFTKDDKEYLGLIIDPIHKDITRLNDGMDKLNGQFDDHDEKTNKIEKTQDQMIGGLKVLLWTVVPIIVSVITWYLTKS